MSTVNDLLSILSTNEKNIKSEDDEEEKGKIVIKRYFPGKIPHYAKDFKEDDEEDEEEEEECEEDDELTEKYAHEKKNDGNVKHTEGDTIRVVDAANLHTFPLKHSLGDCEDERYKRFEEDENENHILGEKDERLKRRIRNVVVLKKEEEEEEGQTKGVEIFITNNAAKSNKRNRNEVTSEVTYEEKERKTENVKEEMEDAEDEHYDEDEYEDEYEDEDEDDDVDSYMEDEEDAEKAAVAEGDDAKPNFIFKNSRKTLIEEKGLEELEKQKKEIFEKEKKLIEQEQRENAIKEALYPEMIEEELRQKGKNVLSSEEEFDEEEEYDEETKRKEYELWKIREINRLKRDEFEREKYNILKNTIKKRRKMTDKEIIEDNKNLPNKQKKKRRSMLFLQKYYHRGGFYQDLFEEGKEEIYKRDYNEPVYEDTIDKTRLPKVLRLRRGAFGKQGRTKYTHLLDNDTSIKDSLWKEGEVQPNSKKKTDLLDRPTYKKK